MIRIAVGPASAAPSWGWIGRDMVCALPGDYAISVFDSFDACPDADIVFVVKQRPPVRFMNAAGGRPPFLVYAPVDIYVDPAEIDADAPMLARCDLVLLHSEALEPYIAPLVRRVATVDHHLRYLLDRPAPYRTDGFVLWVGASGNLPYLLRWLALNPVPYEVRLLTDAFGKERRIAAHYLADRQGVRLRFGQDSINGFPAFAWSEALQHSMMRSCRAAIDIKGNDFNQASKPPTKAQKFIASGIPFACNADSPMAGHFHRRGFDLASPNDAARLLSYEYWNETHRTASVLRRDLSFDAVAAFYRREFDTLAAPYFEGDIGCSDGMR